MKHTLETEFVYNSSKEWYTIPTSIISNVNYYTLKAITLTSYVWSLVLDHDINLDVQVENPTPQAPSVLTFNAGITSVNTVKTLVQSFTQLIPDEQTIFELNPLNNQQFITKFETSITYVVTDVSRVTYDIWFVKTCLGLNNPIMPQDVQAGDLIVWTIPTATTLRFLPSSLTPQWEIGMGWESSSFNLNGYSQSDASGITTKTKKYVEISNNITEIPIGYSAPTVSGMFDVAVIKMIIRDKTSKLKYFSDRDININMVWELDVKEPIE